MKVDGVIEFVILDETYNVSSIKNSYIYAVPDDAASNTLTCVLEPQYGDVAFRPLTLNIPEITTQDPGVYC